MAHATFDTMDSLPLLREPLVDLGLAFAEEVVHRLPSFLSETARLLIVPPARGPQKAAPARPNRSPKNGHVKTGGRALLGRNHSGAGGV
jgi:hypothetical protein